MSGKIKSNKELISFVKNEILKETKVQVTIEYSVVKAVGGDYFKLEIDCPLIHDQLKNNTISFNMGYAKKDYFKEGFILYEDDIKKKLEDVIKEIRYRLQNIMCIVMSSKSFNREYPEWHIPINGKYTSFPSNKYVLIEGDKFIGIDNSTNDAWVEEFKTLRDAMRWLDEYDGTVYVWR